MPVSNKSIKVKFSLEMDNEAVVSSVSPSSFTLLKDQLSFLFDGGSLTLVICLIPNFRVLLPRLHGNHLSFFRK